MTEYTYQQVYTYILDNIDSHHTERVYYLSAATIWLLY